MLNNFGRDGSQDQGLSIDRLENDRNEFRKNLRMQFEHSSWPKAYLLAEALREDAGIFSNWMKDEFGAGIANMPADRLLAWTQLAGPGLLRWVARRCGFDLVVRDSAPGRLLPSVERLLGMFSADAGAALGQRLEGKALDLDQWKHIQHGVNAIVDVLELDRKRVKA